MKSVSGNDLARAVEHRGWKLLRIHGSHHIYGKDGVPHRLAIPVHEDHDMKDGLLIHLMKMAGVEEGEL